MNLLEPLLHMFFPRLCLACGDDAVREELVCFSCLSQLPYTQFHLHRDNKAERVFYGRVRIEAGMSLLYFSKNMLVQNLMHELKYKGQEELGHFLGRLMGKALAESAVFGDVDKIVPLPLSDKKRRQRGYNQSELLCHGIAEVIRKPVCTRNLLRGVHTATQTHKHRRERWQNVEGIFRVANPDAYEGKHLLLVDDVLTTGATLEACISTLVGIPAVRVSIATLAIAVK